jgi:putative aminopeptidase FrvX
MPNDDGYCQPFSADGYRDQNVIAHLNPERACFVVLGAHYDALGEDAAGRIRPGADDDATGVAVMLEVARLVATSARRPRAGLVLAAFGAEENGLVGSQAYVAQPTVPLERVALMVNVDMAGRRPGGRYPSIGWEASGPERRATAALVRRAADAVQVGAIPMRLGDRGDSASFAPHVPTVFFSTAVHPDYHQPTDTPERVDYGQVERALKVVLELIERVECDSLQSRKKR